MPFTGRVNNITIKQHGDKIKLTTKDEWDGTPATVIFDVNDTELLIEALREAKITASLDNW